MIEVKFLPSQRIIRVHKESSILQAAILAGVQVESTCGGKGTCGKCKVRIESEQPMEPLTVEKKYLSPSQLAEGWVLACQRTLASNTIIYLNEQKDAYDRKTGLEKTQDTEIYEHQTLDTDIQKVFLKVKEPSTSDQRSDWERLTADLNIKFNRSLASTLPRILRKAHFQVTAVLKGEELLAVEPGDTRSRKFGLAIDIGTTTIVVYLLDLFSGQSIARGALTNPQQGYGADVIARITYASDHPEGLDQLQEKVITGLNSILTRLCQEQGIRPEEIYQAVVVGNTSMSHLFLGIDPAYLAPAPFVPAFRQAVTLDASELGLKILATGKITVLPNVAGYVGSDTVGVMLAAHVDQLDGINLLVDIGTNGEIVLVGKGRILTCSTAAGPAFEGAGVKHGMRAAVGAIEQVKISSEVELGVIGGGKACGICGSGLIDAISEMLQTGLINSTGRMANPASLTEQFPSSVRERLREIQGNREFVLVWGKDSATGEDLVITQKDIRELQLAKGALLAGIRILLKELSVEPEELDQILLAGAFGNYIQKKSALNIGLLPTVPPERITSIGNAAGEGAKLALLSAAEKRRANKLAQRAEHIELSTHQDFQEEFVNALALKE